MNKSIIILLFLLSYGLDVKAQDCTSSFTSGSLNQMRQHYLSCNITDYEPWLKAEIKNAKDKTIFFISNDEKKMLLAAVSLCRVNNQCIDTFKPEINKNFIKDIEDQVYEKSNKEKVADNLWKAYSYSGNNNDYFLNHWNSTVAERIADAQANLSQIQILKLKVANFLLARYAFNKTCDLVGNEPLSNRESIRSFVKDVYTVKRCNGENNCSTVYDCSSVIAEGKTFSNATYQSLIAYQYDEDQTKRTYLLSQFQKELDDIFKVCDDRTTTNAESCTFNTNAISNTNARIENIPKLMELVNLAKDLKKQLNSGTGDDYTEIVNYIPITSCIDSNTETGVESCRK